MQFHFKIVQRTIRFYNAIYIFMSNHLNSCKNLSVERGLKDKIQYSMSYIELRSIKMAFENIQKDDTHDTAKESFEEVPLITGILTYVGFYILMLAGFVSQLFVKQNLEVEKNRDVSVINGLQLQN